MAELTAAGPVLVHFFDPMQLNSVRALPYIAEWHRRYSKHGLTTLAIHSPRFALTADEAVATQAIERLGIEHPVALDLDYAIWQDYGCKGWPSLFFWGRGGALRWAHNGEGEYAATEEVIQEEIRLGDIAVELPPTMAPLRPTDEPGALMPPPTPEAFPGRLREGALDARGRRLADAGRVRRGRGMGGPRRRGDDRRRRGRRASRRHPRATRRPRKAGGLRAPRASPDRARRARRSAHLGDQLRPGHALRYAVGIARAEVPARAGLVGNPSDAFGGAIVGLAIDELRATVAAEPALTVELEADGETLEFEDFADLSKTEGHPTTGPLALMWAAAKRFSSERPTSLSSKARIKLESSSIPPGVGLAGSSAIVIATLRALGELFGDEIADRDLPSIALAAEREELGITAGLGDRVVQVYGGLVYLDLARADGPRVEPLDASRLPDVFVAWRPDAATDSGDVHREMRERFKAGETEVVGTMREIAGLARAALKPLLTGDTGGLGILMERNLELRRSLYDLDKRHTEMADAAHGLGAAVNYTGSGGAIVGLLRDDAQLGELREALSDLGCELVVCRSA